MTKRERAGLSWPELALLQTHKNRFPIEWGKSAVAPNPPAMAAPATSPVSVGGLGVLPPCPVPCAGQSLHGHVDTESPRKTVLEMIFFWFGLDHSPPPLPIIPALAQSSKAGNVHPCLFCAVPCLPEDNCVAFPSTAAVEARVSSALETCVQSFSC